MNLITEPSVYLLGYQQVDEDELSRFLDDHKVSKWTTDTEVGGEKLVEVAGRICYMSFAKPRPGGNRDYIEHILEVGHGSVLEHAVYNFAITGVSRSFTHELVRHRAGFGYSQLSQRFVDESDAEFVVPPLYLEAIAAAQATEVHNTARNTFDYIAMFNRDATRFGGVERFKALAAFGRDWQETIEAAQLGYRRLVEKAEKLFPELAEIEDKTLRRKKARESARSVLPNATETKIFVTGNVRALRHFVEMRGDAAADAEIRGVAMKMLAVLQSESPALFGDYRVEDGSIRTDHAKV